MCYSPAAATTSKVRLLLCKMGSSCGTFNTPALNCINTNIFTDDAKVYMTKLETSTMKEQLFLHSSIRSGYPIYFFNLTVSYTQLYLCALLWRVFQETELKLNSCHTSLREYIFSKKGNP